MDDDGQLVGDLPLLDLLLALRNDPEARVGQLLDDEEPVTVGPGDAGRPRWPSS